MKASLNSSVHLSDIISPRVTEGLQETSKMEGETEEKNACLTFRTAKNGNIL